ncbi:uncharacterized protein LOC113871845 [Abrus precatorius]|uniref:Uncharacterized protein LOC113871845 n=1 Tax=Abrus precatorius TaxID=3816 RepID=A0A8B8M886_ABRPR|nr:uncharacterized protein LOC113871845 [Abrus precatorius]
MDVILELQGGKSFTISVEPFDTVLRLKEKVQKFQRIPISDQTFVFNGQVLQDHLDIWTTQVYEGSHIHLLLPASPVLPEFPPSMDAMDMFIQEFLTEPPEIMESLLANLDFPAQPQIFPKSQPTQQMLACIQSPPQTVMATQQMHEFPQSLPQTIMSTGKMPAFPQSPESLPQMIIPTQFPPSPPQMAIVTGSQPQLPRKRKPGIQKPMPPPPPPSHPSWAWKVSVQLPHFKDRIAVELNWKDSFLKLKEKILQLEGMKGVAMDRVVLQSHKTKKEFIDQQLLKDCTELEPPEVEINVIVKPLPSPKQLPVDGVGTSNHCSGSIIKHAEITVMLLPMRTSERILIQVSAGDKVAVLRTKLEELQKTFGFRLPKDGRYFFIHGQRAMDEKKSFKWHQVGNGDIIKTFDGSIS